MNSSSWFPLLENDDLENINYFEYFERVYSTSQMHNGELSPQVTNMFSTVPESAISEPNVIQFESNLDVMLEGNPLFIDCPETAESPNISVSCLKTVVDTLRKDNEALNRKNEDLQEDIKDLRKICFDIDCRVIQNSQYSRRENLIITGIPDSVDQKSLEKTVLSIIKSVGLNDISSYEITACHRLVKKEPKFSAPTIVRFINRKYVDFCLTNRRRLLENRYKLNGMNLRFYENLCRENEQVTEDCKALKFEGIIKNFTVRNGFTKIVKRNGQSCKIRHPSELHNMFKNFLVS